ncbi:MAG: polymer-forming cytoskeletal protein [Pseudomonadota bacterium]
MSSKPHSTSFRPEISKRPLEIPTRGTGNRTVSTGNANQDGKKLTVGRDIRLAGEIGSCDVLVVEGHVEAQIKECDRLEIAEGGAFVGSATVTEAEISGRFEGELNARRITILSSAEIDGKLKYGSLQVENGAKIKGSLDYVEGSDDAFGRAPASAAITIPRKSDDL